MRYSSFSVFLNFLLTLIIIVGGFTVYKIGIFDGIDMTTLKKNYINKKSLKFSDLPKNERTKYISTNSIEGGNKNPIGFEDINFDENSMNSIGDLKNIIRNLKNKFLIIQNDNLMLYNEKEKLAKLLEKSKNLLNEQKRKLTTKSLEQINETEKQHYRNISELTTKINDLKRENMKLSQGSNVKIIELRNKVSMLTKKVLAIKNEKNKNKILNQTTVLLQKKAKLLQKDNEIKNQKNIEKDKILQLRDGKIAELQTKIIILQKDKDKIKDELQSEMASLKNKKVELKLKIQTLNSKLENMKKQKQALKVGFLSKIEKNEKKHNENYKILNKQILKYESEIAKIKNSKKKFIQKENAKILEIKDAFNELTSDVKKRDKQYKTTIQKLKYELKERKLFYAKKYKNIKPNKQKKLVLIDKIDCQDMPYGDAKATLKCKVKVDKFLSKYDSTYFYKIVPIVDNGGFESLKKLDSKSNIIPKKEIKRLTSLANLGLGKYRAVEGGRLVKEKFKDFAKISYAPENISIGKNRGFIIRVYR